MKIKITNLSKGVEDTGRWQGQLIPNIFFGRDYEIATNRSFVFAALLLFIWWIEIQF